MVVAVVIIVNLMNIWSSKTSAHTAKLMEEDDENNVVVVVVVVVGAAAVWVDVSFKNPLVFTQEAATVCVE